MSHVILESEENDTIVVIQNATSKGKEEDTSNSIVLGKKFPITITKSLHFVCMSAKCKLYTPRNSFAFVAGHTTKQINVSFANFQITEENYEGRVEKKCKPSSHGFIATRGSTLKVASCVLTRLCTAVFIVGLKGDVTEINLTQTSVEQVHYTVYSKNVSLIKLEMTDTVIIGEKESPVPYYAISLIITDVAFIHIVNCSFQNVNEAIAVSMYRKKLLLRVAQCQFKENSGQSVLLSFSSLLRPEESRIHLEGLKFFNNDAGFASSVHLIRSFRKDSNSKEPGPTIHLADSTFKNNYAQAFFGAIYADGVVLEISNTTFYNNSAGNEESSIQAFGGAIFVESETNVRVFNSSFSGNTCSGFGGAVFSRGSFSAINTLFRGSFKGSASPLLGDILYVTAGLHLENTTWYPSKSFRSNSAIWHPGSPTLEPWKIRIQGYFNVFCPVGHNITGHGLVREPGMLTDRISMGCRSCPRNQYSLQSGHLKVVSKASRIVSKHERKVSCLWCRYGGVCEQGKIKARSNYYGHLTKDSKEVRFISCPFGYCCQGMECRSYNACSPSREGTLCGSCVKGTTENLLSARCVKYKDCRDKWFWSIYFPFGIIYILFFMYIDKISKFLKGQFLWVESKVVDSDKEDDKDSSKGDVTGVIESAEETIEEKALGNEANDPAISVKDSDGIENMDSNDIEDHSKTDYKRKCSASPVHDENNDNIHDAANKPLPDTSGKAEIRNKPRSAGHSKHKSDVFSDIINITFYFYQMIFIIRDHDNTVLTKTFAFIKEISNSIFTFSIGSKSTLSLCPIEGLTPVSKSILVRSIAIYVIAMLLMMNIANAVYIIVKRKCRALKRVNIGEVKYSFSVRLRVTTIQIMLLAYSTVTNMIINFVNCVPVNGHYVLYMDGTIKCFNWLQISALVFIAFWIVPFPFALVLAIHRMHHNSITYNRFIIGLIFPFFYVLWDTALKFRRGLLNAVGTESSPCEASTPSASEGVNDDIDSISVEEILRRFEAPFKDSKGQTSISKQPGIWQGVMIMRRLIIILLFTFVNSPVTRLYCIFIACLLFLIHHLIYLPYQKNLVNLVETCSSSTLVVFCSVNLFFAYSYVSNVPPEHADERISAVFNWLEVVILVFFPVLFIVLLIIFVLIRFCTAIYRGLCDRKD